MAASSSISAATSASIPRGVGRIAANGRYSFATSTTSQYSASNIRAAATDGTNNFWGAGGNSGTFYFGTASAANTVQSTLANTRIINIFNGNLCFSVGAGTSRGVYGFSSLPVTSSSASFQIDTSASSSPYGFAINPGGNIAYVADDSGSGIARYTNSAGTWSAVYVVSANNARGLAVDWSGAAPKLHATATTNSVIAITDTGASSPVTVLVAGAASIAFRGIAFAPLAAPTITQSPISQTVNCGNGVTLTAAAVGQSPLA